jgi:hypothetical protein
MKRVHRQRVAVNLGLSAQYLTLFELKFEVKGPEQIRKKGNATPFVIHVTSGKLKGMRIYNDTGGYTWARRGNKRLPEVHTNTDLYDYLRREVEVV